MAQRKIDRFAQMSMQEELIAKKRREILEKQRTAELAKQVAAAMKVSKSTEEDSEVTKDEEATQKGEKANDEQISTGSRETQQQQQTQARPGSLAGRVGKFSSNLKRSQQVPVTEQPPPKVQNSFCNDGSFLDHFKKILEKQEPPKIVTESVEQAPPIVDEEKSEENETTDPIQMPVHPTTSESTPIPVAVSLPTPPQPFSYNPSFLPQNILLSSQSQPAHVPPPDSLAPLPAAAFFGSHFANFAPPPPPPPQLPISLANIASLYMIPAPEPLQLSAIQAPKEFDLNAIPNPQLNLEAIQVPTTNSTQQQLSSTTQPLMQGAPQVLGDFSKNLSIEYNQQQHQQQDNHSDNTDFNCLQLPTSVENLVALVALHGDEYEDKIRTQKSRLHPAMWFLFDKNCQQYQQYRQKIKEAKFLQNSQDCDSNTNTQDNDQDQESQNESGEKYDPESALGGDIDSDDEYIREMHDRNLENLQKNIERQNEELSDGSDNDQNERKKKRKSRWGDKVQSELNQTANLSSTDATTASAMSSFANQHKPMLTKITRTDPGLLNYARLNYGSTNLTEEDWQKCEEHYKVNLLYQDMMRKREEIDRLAKSGKFRYEYDSDEDVDGGTWEHKLRTAEMEATKAWAQALTKQSEGKHHIGDFLPPEELKKFMEQYDAKKNNRQPDLSDYKEYKLKEDNIGFQMLQKLGWKEGQGLGSDGAGITLPINKAPQREGNQGLGVSSAATPEECDNEYDAYRKRMMLAYRFRPNPLNNPRRAYY